MDQLALLRSVPLFAELKDQEMQVLSEAASFYRYPKNSMIVLAQEEGNTLFIIGKGRVKVSIQSEDGREIVLSLLVCHSRGHVKMARGTTGKVSMTFGAGIRDHVWYGSHVHADQPREVVRCISYRTSCIVLKPCSLAWEVQLGESHVRQNPTKPCCLSLSVSQTGQTAKGTYWPSDRQRISQSALRA